MALNEHKNLEDANRHNPMGFEAAANDTLLSKDVSGNLNWVAKNIIKTTCFSVQGFTTANGSTYEYRQAISDAQSPFELNTNYTSGTVGGATISPNVFHRFASWVAQDDCTVLKIRGWLTGNGGTATLALCKITPVEDTTTAVTPVLIDEIEIATSGNNNMWEINETSFTTSSISASDVIFPMIKSDTASKIIYFNVTVEVGYIN